MRHRLLTHLVVLLCLLSVPSIATAATDRSTDGDRPAPVVLDDAPERGEKAVDVALRYLGTPYAWAGSTPSGFDCSGFVMYVYGRVGVALPHSSSMLWGVGRAVSEDQLEPGDIVFFNGLSHVGIYVGHGHFVHSPHSGDVVRISSLSESWYASTYDGARRVG
jgi:cell wall-associated NlpC family hydrolase